MDGVPSSSGHRRASSVTKSAGPRLNSGTASKSPSGFGALPSRTWLVAPACRWHLWVMLAVGRSSTQGGGGGTRVPSSPVGRAEGVGTQGVGWERAGVTRGRWEGAVSRGTSLEPRLQTGALSLRGDGGVEALKSRPIFNCGPQDPESSRSTLHDGWMRACDLTYSLLRVELPHRTSPESRHTSQGKKRPIQNPGTHIPRDLFRVST